MVWVFHEADDGRSCLLSVGELVVVELAENPTTGFQWSLEADEGVRLQASEYVQDPGGAIGGGGRRRFPMVIYQPGAFSIRAKLWRSWEGDRSICARFGLVFQVGRKER